MTQPIPQPELLDPERPLRPHDTRMQQDRHSDAELFKSALEDSCAYARQLWNDLDGLRSYLLDCLPPDPRAPGLHATASASPTGPDDEAGWDRWITAYAAVTSALAGPQGDSGYGLGEARREAELRRSAPVLALQAEHPDVFTEQPAAQVSPPAPGAATHATDAAPDRGGRSGPHPLHTAATVVLAFLAVRGLRARHPRRVPAG